MAKEEPKNKVSSWDDIPGEQYGGDTDVLVIPENNHVGPLTYLGAQPMKTHIGDTTSHQAVLNGETVRLPIGATFLRAMDLASIHPGDEFWIKRFANTKKKSGAGQGTDMQIFAIKVTKKAPRQLTNAGGQPY